MGLTLITPASAFPVTLEEAKAQVRVRHSTEDEFISDKIAAATRFVEQSLSLSIAEQTWRWTLDTFSDQIELPRGPVKEITAFTYRDEAGDEQSVTSDFYTLDLTSRSPWIIRNSDVSWPVPMSGVNMVAVTYTAGMDVVPADIKAAILLQVQILYERGGDPRVVDHQNNAIDSLLQSYRWVLA